jgi:hypothetical protein
MGRALLCVIGQVYIDCGRSELNLLMAVGVSIRNSTLNCMESVGMASDLMSVFANMIDKPSDEETQENSKSMNVHM